MDVVTAHCTGLVYEGRIVIALIRRRVVMRVKEGRGGGQCVVLYTIMKDGK